MAAKSKKKEKKELEPQYYTSATNIPTYNYNVYYMKPIEKILYFLLAFIGGAAVGYLFYGGIGADSYGNPTTLTHIMNILIPTVVGAGAVKIFLPARTKQIIAKQKKELSNQFRDMLDGITTAIGSGNNVVNSFNMVYSDLKIQYAEGAYILKELEVILSGIQSNFDIEDLLADFGKRSGNEDIISFADVFSVCYRKGGNLQQVVRNTHEILTQKMSIKEEIETIVSGSKMDQMVLAIMPIILIAIIKLASPDMAANFTTIPGIVATTVAIGLFIASYFVGKAVLDIKI